MASVVLTPAPVHFPGSVWEPRRRRRRRRGGVGTREGGGGEGPGPRVEGDQGCGGLRPASGPYGCTPGWGCPLLVTYLGLSVQDRNEQTGFGTHFLCRLGLVKAGAASPGSPGHRGPACCPSPRAAASPGDGPCTPLQPRRPSERLRPPPSSLILWAPAHEMV